MLFRFASSQSEGTKIRLSTRRFLPITLRFLWRVLRLVSALFVVPRVPGRFALKGTDRDLKRLNLSRNIDVSKPRTRFTLALPRTIDLHHIANSTSGREYRERWSLSKGVSFQWRSACRGQNLRKDRDVWLGEIKDYGTRVARESRRRRIPRTKGSWEVEGKGTIDRTRDFIVPSHRLTVSRNSF